MLPAAAPSGWRCQCLEGQSLDHFVTGSWPDGFRPRLPLSQVWGPLGQILTICGPPWLRPAASSEHLASVRILGALLSSDVVATFVSFQEDRVHCPVWHPEQYRRIFLPLPIVNKLFFFFFWPSLNLKPNSKGGIHLLVFTRHPVTFHSSSSVMAAPLDASWANLKSLSLFYLTFISFLFYSQYKLISSHIFLDKNTLQAVTTSSNRTCRDHFSK